MPESTWAKVAVATQRQAAASLAESILHWIDMYFGPPRGCLTSSQVDPVGAVHASATAVSSDASFIADPFRLLVVRSTAGTERNT